MMRSFILKNFAAVVFSVAIHVLLVGLLVLSFDWKPTPKSLVVKQNVVKAVAIDANKVQAELDKLKRADDRKKKKEKDRVAKLKKEENKLRKKRAAEEKKLADLKKKRQSEEKQRKLEQKNLAKLKKQQAELKKKQLAEAKKRKAEKQKQAALKKKQDELKKKQEIAKKKREAEKKQRQKELAQQLAAEEKAQADELAKREIDKYQVLIRQKVERNWLKPPGNLKGLVSVIEVRLIPGGDVIDVGIVKTSGNLVFDRSVERAVRKASPLPLPKNLAIASRMYEFKFIFEEH